MARTNLVELAGDEQFRGFKGFRKAAAQAIKEQANSNHCTYAWVIRSIHERDICSKAMTNDTNLGWIHPWLGQGSIDGSGKIKRFHPSVRLFSLALAHSTKVKAQRHHTHFCCQAFSQCHGQWVTHIATGRLRMAEHSNRRVSHSAGNMQYAFQQK